MKIDSPRFGTLEIAPEKVIEFPNGLLGFEDARRFSLFHPEGARVSYYILQSIDDPLLAFNIADPALFGFDYEISLSDAEAASVDLTDSDDAVVMVILAKGEMQPDLRANFTAPLVLNLRSRKALQHVFSRLNYQVTLKASQP
ncbi:hypothetical protein B9N43_14010 [Denitratisoma sp. DHT3]|uniref:flagellar assembly protein FliW n=1 Tax=Denitratisoma sp. DHT3 TaxID=1981880 RepID=UPI001198A210|nr:flagellar assembly protein FliW [Denitratisoma sp. DHT3]QDX82258.1 hypothetical protein B9N43_14010 [Denitratisoma sp. DHT3]